MLSIPLVKHSQQNELSLDAHLTLMPKSPPTCAMSPTKPSFHPCKKIKARPTKISRQATTNPKSQLVNLAMTN